MTDITITATWGTGSAGTAAVIPYGAAMFAPDHLAAAKTAALAGNAPYSASYSQVVQAGNSQSGRASSRVAIAAVHSLPTNVFGAASADSTVQGLYNPDCSAAACCAFGGFLQNFDAPTAVKLVKDWTTGSQFIAGYTIVNLSDGPLMASTVGSGFVFAAILFDEHLQGNWSALTSWTAADRTNAEAWVIAPWYSASALILGESPKGNFVNWDNQNNWASHALQTHALAGFYLLGSSNPTNVALGRTYISGTADRIARQITGSITNPNDSQVGQAFFPLVSGTGNFISSAQTGKFNPGDNMEEDERSNGNGGEALSYTMFSARSLVSAIHVVRAAGGPDLFAKYSSSINLMLNTLLFHCENSPVFMSCYAATPNGGAQLGLPYDGREVYEAMGAYYSSSAYTAYAAQNRPTGGKTTMIGAAGQGAIGVHSFATLTSLLGTSGSVFVNTVPVAAATASISITGHGQLSYTASLIPNTSNTGQFFGAGPNQPAGMTTVVNTGQITGDTATFNSTMAVIGGSWTTTNQGTTNVWANFTTSGSARDNHNPAGVGAGGVNTNGVNSGSGLNPTYIMLASGSGIRQRYDTTLAGGNNAVSWGLTADFSPVGTGKFYYKAYYRFINWSNIGALGAVMVGVKLAEPRNDGANDVCATFTSLAATTDLYCNWLAQGTGITEDYPRMDQSPFSDIRTYIPHSDIQVTGSAYMLAEWVVQQETTAGTSNDAYVKIYVNGNLAYDTTTTGATSGLGTWLTVPGFNVTAVGSPRGWNDLIYNMTFGGADWLNGPTQAQYIDVDCIYMAVS